MNYNRETGYKMKRRIYENFCFNYSDTIGHFTVVESDAGRIRRQSACIAEKELNLLKDL